MISMKVLGMVVGAFIAGSFVASPELRAYAAATIGSAEIIDNSIQSVDIKDGQVKSADLAGSAVTSGKIKDGEVKRADLSPAFFKKVVLSDDATGHAAGWDPHNVWVGPQPYEWQIQDSDVKSTSEVIMHINLNDTIVDGARSVGQPTPLTDCYVDDVRQGSFNFRCEQTVSNIPDGSTLHYIVVN